MLADERIDGRTLEIRNHRHTGTTGAASALLHSSNDQSCFPALQLPASPQTGLWSSNPCVINLHVAVQGLAREVHHGPAQLMQYHPRRFIARESELALHEERRHATLVGGHQIRRPEPNRQGRLRVVKNRASRKRDLVPTCRTLPSPMFRQLISPSVSTPGTNEPVGPAARSQIFLTRLFTGKLGLKLAQTLRKRGTWQTLLLVAC